MDMLQRHDFLFLSREGAEFARRSAYERAPEAGRRFIDELILCPGPGQIPAIVKRQEERSPDTIEAGFSSYRFIDGCRFRVAAKIPRNGVLKAITPFELVRDMDKYGDPPRKEAVLRLYKAAFENGVELGVYGSTALGIVTSLPYVRPDSDIDVLVRKNEADADLSGFYREAVGIGKVCRTPLDIEIQTKNGYGAKLKELFSEQATVLAKGLYDVRIFGIDEFKEFL